MRSGTSNHGLTTNFGLPNPANPKPSGQVWEDRCGKNLGGICRISCRVRDILIRSRELPTTRVGSQTLAKLSAC